MNPAYKPSNKYIRPGLTTAGPSKPSPAAAARPSINTAPNARTSTASPAPSSLNTPVEPGVTKEVVIGGVAFESSARSLVRKDRKSQDSVRCKIVFVYRCSLISQCPNLQTRPWWAKPRQLHAFNRAIVSLENRGIFLPREATR